MYPIHTTPGFIIDSRPTGEAGKVLSIFTRDLGLVFATAQGIRLEKSKLRYHAQDHLFGVFSFVRGKEFWRLTSSQEEQEVGSMDKRVMKTQARNRKELLARIALLLRRLLHGEEAHPELFQCVESCKNFLEENPGLDDEGLKTLESIVVLRILHTLGYIGNNEELKEFLQSPLSSLRLTEVAVNKRTLINQHINRALKESHL